MSGSRVIVVGSVNADLVVVAGRLPAPGETVTGGRFSRHGGGKGANQAVAAARLGADVRMVGAVGDDDLGGAAVRALRDEGIDITQIAVVDQPTGVALIVVDAAGENQIAVASGANWALRATNVESATKRNPTGRMTTPQDVAKAIVVLSGEGTDFINGEVIGVDGGEFITGS